MNTSGAYAYAVRGSMSVASYNKYRPITIITIVILVH